MNSSNLVPLGSRPFLLAYFRSNSYTGAPRRPKQPLRHCLEGQTRPSMDSLFINALVQAGTCSKHGTASCHSMLPPSFFTYHKPRRRLSQPSSQQARHVHDSSAPSELRPRRRTITREEYKRLVDYYRESYTTQAGSGESIERETPKLVLATPPDESGHLMVVTDEDRTEHKALTPTPDEKPTVLEMLRILCEDEAEQQQVFSAYSAMPFPGVAYLEDRARRRLFHQLSRVEMKSPQSMMRYLSVIDDMKSADIRIRESEWNSAISFAGRCYAKVTAVEVEAALRIWKEMEEQARVKSGNVTFSILFDIATKAGKYVLAEMILKEMASRNLPLNRFAHTGLIYYYGVRQDGQGVRKAYRELVEAGHIVDNVVMDCVTASLLRAGELPAAEQVYERRKQLFARMTDARVPTMDWRKVRELGNVLDKAKLAWTDDSQKIQQIQAEQYLGPDLRMYTSFVEYHCSVSGELRRVTNMLDEMQSFGIPMSGRIFVKLFKGFAFHGGVKYTSWTRARLENVWISLKSVLDSQVKDVSIQKWMVIWMIRAFAKCCGRERTLELWAEIRSRWKPDPEELVSVHHKLTETLNPVPGSASGYRERDIDRETNNE